MRNIFSFKINNLFKSPNLRFKRVVPLVKSITFTISSSQRQASCVHETSQWTRGPLTL